MPPKNRFHSRGGQRTRATGIPSPLSRPSSSVTPSSHYPMHGLSPFGLSPFVPDFYDDDDDDDEYDFHDEHFYEREFEKLALKIGKEDAIMLAKAEKDMEKVDELFNAGGDLAAACSAYASIISHVVENMPLDIDNYINASNLITSLHLRIADGKLKLGDFDDVVSRCSLVLSNMDHKSVKAFVRRGQAFLGMKDYCSAKLDFENALKIEPDNEEIKGELAEVVEKMAEFNSALKDGSVKKLDFDKSLENEADVDKVTEELGELAVNVDGMVKGKAVGRDCVPK